MPGAATSKPEVTHISMHGFWLLVDDRELFLPFEKFPWFAEAPVRAIHRVERPRLDRFRWPDLDVDLSHECIEDPDRFPLISRDGLGRR